MGENIMASGTSGSTEMWLNWGRPQKYITIEKGTGRVISTSHGYWGMTDGENYLAPNQIKHMQGQGYKFIEIEKGEK